jgi:hypothetical protein
LFIDDVEREIREIGRQGLEQAWRECLAAGVHQWRALSINVQPAAHACARCKVVKLGDWVFWPVKPPSIGTTP